MIERDNFVLYDIGDKVLIFYGDTKKNIILKENKFTKSNTKILAWDYFGFTCPLTVEMNDFVYIVGE
jgi:hypothetical protein